MNKIMRDEILDQPGAIRQSLPQLRSQIDRLGLKINSGQKIIFTGSGDSFIAPLALLFAARLHCPANVYVLSALDAAHYWSFSANDILVPISISGKAIRTVEAAQLARKKGANVLAITANADSNLAAISDHSIIIPFQSRSRITPHTTDYLTTLLAISGLLEHLAGNRFSILDSLIDTVTQQVRDFEGPLTEIGYSLRENNQFYFLGGGPHFATAFYAAAKFWEVGGLLAGAFDLEEFAHGPHLMVKAGDPVFIVAPNGGSIERARQIVDGLRELTTELYVITDAKSNFPGIHSLIVPTIAEEWSAFTTTIPLQWLCWGVANAKGYDVVKKDGLHDNPESYEAAHRKWVRGLA